MPDTNINSGRNRERMPLLGSLRDLLYKSFLALPLLLAGFTLFMGATQGNIGLLVLFLGMATIVPITAALFNLLFEFLLGNTSAKSLFSVPFADVCQLIMSAPKGTRTDVYVAPSYWMALLSFFFSYLFTNAGYLYNMPADENADPAKVENRKSQVLTAIIVSAIVFATLIVARYFLTGCETLVGLLMSLIVGGGLAWVWYIFAKFCKARDADIFGIVQGILPKNMDFTVPVTCVYKGT